MKDTRRRLPRVPTVRVVALVLALLVPASPTAAQPESPRRDYIVTLAVGEAGALIDPASRPGRERLRRRAERARSVTDRLESAVGFRARHRYSVALAGFSAELDEGQADRLRRDPAVAEVRVARRYRLASQTIPTGIRRVSAVPGGAVGDVDADVAILDTGVGPVGGGELDVRGGMNCSGDRLGPEAWQDLYPSHHGTHVAGTVAARDNGLGAVGVAPGARVWSVRVFRRDGLGNEATLVCGLDWVLSTHGPSPPPGSQPIDVVNLSVQGPRPPGDPESCSGRPVPDPDPVHLAVCALHAADITVVAAAGNDALDARLISPAGYDQVITVGAISDFDGRSGSRAAPSCPATLFGREVDDRWARYSNRGADVDILAPGSCILSTRPSFSGGATAVMTGTSMATPHVSGAVARLLAVAPGTPPERVRRTIIAAGRLDWDIASEPGWSWPASSRPPQRLLDVGALVAPPGLRVWLHPRSLVAARTARQRQARVDVQRLGGYEGAVDLRLEGLPPAAGESSFAPGAVLAGIGDLGARLELGLDPGGAEGAFALSVEAHGVASAGDGGTAADAPVGRRRLDLLVDRSGPVVGGPGVAIRAGGIALGAGQRALVRFRWSARDALDRVAQNALQRRAADGRWRTLVRGPQLARADVLLRPGRRDAFRVRSADRLGNTAFSPIVRTGLLVRDSDSPRWLRPAGVWQSTPSPGAIGGRVLATRTRGASLSMEVSGRGVAIVAPLAPGDARLRVRLDAGAWQTVDLSATGRQEQRVVWSGSLVPGIAQRLEIQALRGLVAVDALLILR